MNQFRMIVTRAVGAKEETALSTPVNTPVKTSVGGRRARESQVITGAERSYDEQLHSRRKRYLWMMSMRIPLLIAGAACYSIPWLAITLVVISVPLPWMAVLIANDRPARKNRVVLPGTINHERALPPATRDVIDAD